MTNPYKITEIKLPTIGRERETHFCRVKAPFPDFVTKQQGGGGKSKVTYELNHKEFCPMSQGSLDEGSLGENGCMHMNGWVTWLCT